MGAEEKKATTQMRYVGPKLCLNKIRLFKIAELVLKIQSTVRIGGNNKK